MVAIAAIPAGAQLLGLIFILPESPRYLTEIDDKPQARKVLQKIRWENENIENEIEEMDSKIEEAKNENIWASVRIF